VVYCLKRGTEYEQKDFNINPSAFQLLNSTMKRGEDMNGDQLIELERLLPLAEKYGLAVLLMFVLLTVVLIQWRAMMKGDLVPRELLDRAEEDRDRLQAILDKERRTFMKPTMDAVKKLQIDGKSHILSYPGTDNSSASEKGTSNSEAK
jgi:hypothetical protein